MRTIVSILAVMILGGLTACGPKAVNTGVPQGEICADYIAAELMQYPECVDNVFVVLNPARDNGILFCDMDGDPVTPPEIIFHMKSRTAPMDHPGPYFNLSEEPVCIDSMNEVREVTFVPVP